MRITALLENTAFAPEFETEHGLSLYIETRGLRILFDMGQTDMFARNAERLGIDLSRVDFAVLSHGHYDHSGGLARFLELNSTAPVYAHRDFLEPHYSGDRCIGVDPALRIGTRILGTGDDILLHEGISLHTYNAQPRPYPAQDAGMYVLRGGLRWADDFRHEQYLLVEERGRRIAITGCSHKGIRNIARWMRPDVLIGGFHLKRLEAGNPRIEETARDLWTLPTKFYTCHCTGTAQFAALQRMMPGRIDYLSCGQTIEI